MMPTKLGTPVFQATLALEKQFAKTPLKASAFKLIAECGESLAQHPGDSLVREAILHETTYVCKTINYCLKKASKEFATDNEFYYEWGTYQLRMIPVSITR